MTTDPLLAIRDAANEILKAAGLKRSLTPNEVNAVILAMVTAIRQRPEPGQMATERPTDGHEGDRW